MTKRKRFMIVVEGFTYRTRLTKSNAGRIKGMLDPCVNGVRVVPMPEVIG